MVVNNYEIKKADTFLKRLKGLMFLKEAKHGYLFLNCRSIHTFFMRFNIDMIGIKDNKFIYINKNIPPRKIITIKDKKTSIIETPRNPGFNLSIGDEMIID